MLGLKFVRSWPVLAMLALALAGCSGGSSGSSSSPDLLTYLTPGKVPEPPPVVPTRYPDRYKVQIINLMRTSLDNPGKVKDAFIAEPAIKPVAGSPQPLYVTCVRYNPRDNGNQYQGNQSKLVIFLDGQISQYLPGDAGICGGLVYQRFPELEALGPP